MASRRAKLDRLWRIWYALLVLAVHCFLLYSSFHRYVTFRNRALREQWDMSPMNFHLAAGITAALLLPLFLYAAFLRTGNYAEDEVQVGRDRESLRAAVAETASRSAASSGGAGACWGRLRRHFMPYTCALHLLMALCLLVPMPVLEAAEILHGQAGKDQVWRTNLDFVLRPSASATNAVSTEIFNLVLALTILMVRYPSALWFSNRAFSLLFSVILCVCSLHVVLGYEATAVLFKAASTADAAAAVNLAPSAVLALHVVGDLLLLLANVAFFEFGYTQVLNNLRRYRHYLQLEAPSSGSSDRSNGSSCGSAGEAPCWLNYAPHLLGILVMVLSVLCKAPVLWDWVGLYRSHQQPIMLAAIVSGGVHLLLWVAAWFLLCCKTTWQFNIRLEVDFSGKASPGYHSQSHQGLPRPQQQPAVPERRCSPPSSADSDLSKKSNQYVFMHQQRVAGDAPPVSMIPTVSEQVDNASENSYACGGVGVVGVGPGGTLDRQAGLVKYQVRRNSAQLGSLKRNALLAAARGSRAGGNRVTFKDRHETIPGSPGSSQNTSSDSGIEASRIHQTASNATGALQVGLNDDYARVNKQHQQHHQQQHQRAPSRQSSSNYDDYPMLGCLFNQPETATGGAEYYPTDPYGRPLPGVPVLPPPPAGYGTGGAAGDPYGVPPDILLSRSPFNSLGRQPAGKPVPLGAADYYEMQQQQQQQQHQMQHQMLQQQHARSVSASYTSLPPPSSAGDPVEGLCSQV